jgi:hypothetical protein
VAGFLAAGADAVGAGSWLTPKAAIAAGDYDLVRERATALRRAVDLARDATPQESRQISTSGGYTSFAEEGGDDDRPNVEAAG